MRSVWLRHLRTGLCTMTMTGMGMAQVIAPPTPTIDLQASVELGDYLEPDYLSFPVYVTVTNLGPDTAGDVKVDIELPPFLSGRPLGDEQSCDISGSSVECTLLPLDAGASAVVAMELLLPPEPLGTFEVHATTTGTGFDIAPENNQATLSTSGPGRLRLAGGGCSSVAGSGAALAGLALLLPLLRPRRDSRRAQRP
jgi:hypothetical protein